MFEDLVGLCTMQPLELLQSFVMLRAFIKVVEDIYKIINLYQQGFHSSSSSNMYQVASASLYETTFMLRFYKCRYSLLPPIIMAALSLQKQRMSFQSKPCDFIFSSSS